MKSTRVIVPKEQIRAFCERWGLKELSLFGSILRDDFRPDSDIDVLVSFLPGKQMTFENFLDMRDQLSAMFGGRKVDLVQKRLVTNPFRRHEILTTRQVVYAA